MRMHVTDWTCECWTSGQFGTASMFMFTFSTTPGRRDSLDSCKPPATQHCRKPGVAACSWRGMATTLRLHAAPIAAGRPAVRGRRRLCAYDHPALYSSEDAFAERSYWDTRYQQDATTFEWYRAFESLQPVLDAHLPKDRPLLQLGVGTSRLQVDMAAAGWAAIVSVDYSSVAIQRLTQLYPPSAHPGLSYEVADVRSMPQFADASFAGLLDKGCLDALLCGDAAEADAAALLREAWRLLAPGGAFLMVTSAAPASRLPFLFQPATPWCALLVYEVGQQGARAGPWNCCTQDGEAAAAALPTMAYSHCVYVMVKGHE